jgi:hypothetical protein
MTKIIQKKHIVGVKEYPQRDSGKVIMATAKRAQRRAWRGTVFTRYLE